MFNVKYWRILCDVISLLAQVCIVSFDRAYKEMSANKILKIFYDFLWYDGTFKKQSTVPVTLTFDLKVNVFFQWIDNDPISVLYEFQIDISTNSWEIKYQNIGIGFYMLNVAHVKNDVKWRPIVTKFGTLIENMSRTGLYDCHIF